MPNPFKYSIALLIASSLSPYSSWSRFKTGDTGGPPTRKDTVFQLQALSLSGATTVEAASESHLRLLKALAPIAKDRDSSAVYILQRFGDRWEEALSMIGEPLHNPDRQPLIDTMLAFGLGIPAMADLLHLSVDRASLGLESYPEEFRNVIIKNGRGRNAILGRDVSVLWRLFYVLHPQPQVHPSLRFLGRGPLDESERSILVDQKTTLQNLPTEDLIRIIHKKLAPERRGSNYAEGADWHPVINDKQFAMPSQKRFGLLNGNQIQGFKGRVAKDPGYETFSVYLTDNVLLKKLAPYVPTKQFEKDGSLRIGAVAIFGKRQEGQLWDIEYLQSWLQDSDRIPKELRERFGSLEEMLEQAFRYYASSCGVRTLLMPAGNRLFETHWYSLHRNTINRLNRVYAQAGYYLVYDVPRRHYRWRFDIAAPPRVNSLADRKMGRYGLITLIGAIFRSLQGTGVIPGKRLNFPAESS